jgi:hypothetical protein
MHSPRHVHLSLHHSHQVSTLSLLNTITSIIFKTSVPTTSFSDCSLRFLILQTVKFTQPTLSLYLFTAMTTFRLTWRRSQAFRTFKTCNRSFRHLNGLKVLQNKWKQTIIPIMVTNLPPTFTSTWTATFNNCASTTKRKFKTSHFQTYVFGDSGHGANGQFDLQDSLTLSTVH